MKKLIIGYLILFGLLIGLSVAVNLSQQNQNLRRQASVANVDLTLNGPTSVGLNQSFTVDVIVTQTNNKEVTAADLQLNISPAGSLRLDSIDKGDYFATPDMAVPPPAGNTQGWDTVGAELANDPASNRIAIGALCDYCYIGSPPDPNTPPNNLSQCTADPVCYPKAATGKLATYHFTALAQGTATISFAGNANSTEATGTQISVIGSDANTVGDFSPANGLNITVNSSSTPTACDSDINGNLVVDAPDYSILLNNFLKVAPTAYPKADINGNGVVDAPDYSYLVTNWLQNCNN